MEPEILAPEGTTKPKMVTITPAVNVRYAKKSYPAGKKMKIKAEDKTYFEENNLIKKEG